MDPHLWPSLYPAIVVGILIGLGAPGRMGVLKAAAGALGGLVGGTVAYFTLNAVGLGSGAPGSLGMLLAGGAFAWLSVRLLAALRRN